MTRGGCCGLTAQNIGRAFLGDAVDEAPPYPGAKPNFRVDAERWDDAEWMAELVRVTCGALPVAKPKTKK